MDEALKAAAVTDKPNKEFVAAEVLSEKNAHPEVNKYQDSVATDDLEGPENLPPDLSLLPEVPEDHEFLGAG